jgi:AcrR family transcriptional regulator
VALDTQLPTASPRDRLLAAAVGHVLAHGLSDLSLRELAAAIGSSHRMLLYHFGSKEGLIVAIIRTVEQQQRDAFLSIDPDATSADAMREMWRRFTTPALGPHERLFYEIYGQALQGRPGAVDMLDGVIDDWVAPATAYARARGADPDVARVDARLSVAVIRGLLLDWLATGDRHAVDAAFERYLELNAATPDSWLR